MKVIILLPKKWKLSFYLFSILHWKVVFPLVQQLKKPKKKKNHWLKIVILDGKQ